LCELYRELFQQAGYDVWTSSETDDVDEAVGLVRPDVVVIDPVERPGIGQWIHALQSVSDMHPLVVVNSGSAQMRSLEKMDDVNAYVLKSSDVDSLVHAVESVLGSTSGIGR